MTDLSFREGSFLTVNRTAGVETRDKRGNLKATEESHPIGPCSTLTQKGTFAADKDGHSKWVGTVDVQAPTNSDITERDTITLPNGQKAIVIKPPHRPTNPFTGWSPFVTFTIAAPGYTPIERD